MIKLVTKIWGSEEWLVNNELYCAKYLNLVNGYQCSLHYHKLKDETFYVLEGIVFLEVGKRVEPCHSKQEIMEDVRVHVLLKGEQFRLRPWTIHRFYAITRIAKILEVSTTHQDEDSYRLVKSGKIEVF